VLQLGQTFSEPELFFLKPSDRTLYRLFFPDLTSHYDQRNVNQFLAEGHARLAAPLLSIALAMIALAGVLVGDFKRNGYGRRIAIASVVALLVRLATIGVQAAAVDNPKLNALQYALPLVVIFFASSWLPGRAPRRKRQSLGPSVLAEA
jgi:lipopolysaccharide export system permease protein